MPPPINQSQDGLGIRDSLGTSRGVRTMFVQSERGYSVRHGVYVRFSTNQSRGIAYVTGCTYAFRPIRARRSRILISVAPWRLVQPRTTSKKGLENLLLYYRLQ